MGKKEFFILLNKLYGDKIDMMSKDLIADKVLLYNKYISVSSRNIFDVIDCFVYFNRLNVLEKINDNLFVLMKRLLGIKNNNENNINFLDYLKYMVIPYNLLNCDKEDELLKFFGDFETFISLIQHYGSLLDIEMIKSYNNDLYNIVSFKNNKEKELINKGKISNMGFKENIILTTTLFHLLTVFYLKLDVYHKDYDIISKGYDVVYENLDRLIDYCKINNMYNDVLSNDFLLKKNCLEEFVFSRKILDSLNEENKRKVKK